MICSPLAASDCLPPISGVWICENRFSHAINLRNASHQLLTLHRYGQGISPMGWVIRCADFDRLAHFLEPETRLTAMNGGLHTPYFQLLKPRRTFCLRMPDTLQIAPQRLRQYLTPYSKTTGLCGPLNQISHSTSPYLQIFETQLSRWAQGLAPDWRSIIGLGPGLTPSGDDMLVGMMAVLHATSYTAQLPSLLPDEKQLTALTTSVSASYLYYARRGYFSTTLHTLLRRLACGSQGIERSLESMLHHGHTSGADTLLGMDLTLRWQYAHLRRVE
ncbi:DUF2877 domain-containing protein [Hafnia paralvei]|uniref:DUF2877 domain-containing protein n=1 Tax=Hafnia paralvei TaxID=546367 RepID=A0A4Q9EUQ6_9GAMM|nr:DUF2877 domain-containing protein [Hafnia paralvei]TBM28617.1 DUF2877 domain-containing protein [Hafnia paralvei]